MGELTIAGSGFTTDETDFTIDVGGRKCVATAATATSVTCTLENGPAGDFDISLWVQSRGKASGSVTFTLSLAVDSFSPTSGSVGGGTTLTILGTGFPNTMAEWDNNEIAVGGSPCKITETSYTEVTCITPKESTSRRRKRALADLTVTVNGQTASAGSQYNYDASSTPTISTLDPVIGTPTGGETLTITGTIIADSAYEWEGNPSAGLGYYRVPKTMVTEVNGDKIEYEDKMPNTGIVRNDRCSWVEEWHAYKCHDLNHRLMILESMDIDTLDRRLSPVAVLANPGPDGYIDLINGPQDWSCCFGYACQKRVSNFYSIVATNMMYEIQLTSTPPIHMRYRLKNNEGGDPVLLKIYFPKPQRIDIFVGDRFVSPNNIDLTSDTFAMLPPDDSYIPE